MPTSDKYAGTSAGAYANPANAAGSNPATFAHTDVGKNSTGNPLTLTNFGHTVPDGSVVNSISIAIYKSTQDPGGMRDHTIALTLDGASIPGNNLADVSSNWPSPGTEVPVTGTPTTWGFPALTPAQIRAASFGFVIRPRFPVETGGEGQRRARIHYARMTIDFTDPTFMLQTFQSGVWVAKPLRRWDGTAWVNVLQPSVKRWNGAAWV